MNMATIKRRWTKDASRKAVAAKRLKRIERGEEADAAIVAEYEEEMKQENKKPPGVRGLFCFGVALYATGSGW